MPCIATMASLILKRQIRGALVLTREVALCDITLLRLLYTSPAATSPYAAAYNQDHEHQAANKNVRPSAEDFLLVFLLLFLGRDGGVLHLVCGKESVLGIPSCVYTVETDLHEVIVGSGGIGDRHKLNVWVTSVVRGRVNPIAEIKEGVGISH